MEERAADTLAVLISHLSFRRPFHQGHVIVTCHMSMGLHFNISSRGQKVHVSSDKQVGGI